MGQQLEREPLRIGDDDDDGDSGDWFELLHKFSRNWEWFLELIILDVFCYV